MRQADIAIVGGGLAGSAAAAMLGRTGISTILIDPHKIYPTDFRCEKIGGRQIDVLRKMDLYEAVRRDSTLDGYAWTARLGRMLDNKPSDQLGILYDDLVNVMRREIPSTVDFIEGKAASITTSTSRQTVTLSSGEEISARLIILANGLNVGLRDKLGIAREVISACHSITI
jgi:2-polyprenyl-6-methoxyphenol hydroxylase-like FAD-dependent oxidoreductase